MTIEILTSGVALGVHVPGLLLADRLREKGVAVGVSVLERLLPAQKLTTTATMKFAFHRDFRVALADQKMTGSPADSVEPAAVEELFADWRSRGVDRVVVLSGFWLPILAGYDCAIDVCHVGSVSSPSFAKTVTDLDVRHVWLAGAIPCSIPVSHDPPLPWADREPRVLLHGGGWGMGTYRDHIDELPRDVWTFFEFIPADRRGDFTFGPLAASVLTAAGPAGHGMSRLCVRSRDVPDGSVFAHIRGRPGAWREAAAVRLWRTVADQVRGE
jgi:hypothetical protein